MSLSILQELTSRFYQWESRCRGWLVYAAPVDLEPPFEPYYKVLTQPVAFNDDGRLPSIAQRLINVISSLVSNKEQPQQRELSPAKYEPKGYLDAFVISVPKGFAVSTEDSERLLLMISTCRNPVSFEIIATRETISLQFVCHEVDTRYIKNQVLAFLPDCTITDTSSELPAILTEELAACVIDHGLDEEVVRPIQKLDSFSGESLTGLLGVFEYLRDNERAIIQILFKGTDTPWAQSIIQSVTSADGRSFFLDAPDMPKLAQDKVSAPLFAVVVRAIGQADTLKDAWDITRNVSRIITQTTKSPTNCLIPLTNNDYPAQEHLDDVVYRRSRRVGMLLNALELATLVHVPSVTIATSKLTRNELKTKAAPSLPDGASLVLGVNTHLSKERTAAISQEQRLRHMHIVGATGTGKSTLLQNFMYQDLEAGRGFALLDPHGDLVESILERIPPKRLNDVIVIDPSNTEFPIAFNILMAHSEVERNVLSSDLVAIFRRLSTSWGDAMNSVFANGILAFLESTKGGTLMDLRRFFVEKPFRDEFLETVSDPSIHYYWKKEYPLLKSNSIGPILTRMDSFLRPRIIRNMVAQKTSLDFAGIMNRQKILLVKLPQGLIGTENSYLLGSIIVSKIYQTAMARQAMEVSERKDYYLYVDEFQHFITPSMTHILSGARKYRLGLVLAHQDMRQLVKEDTELSDAIMSNAGTRICFRVGDTDAKRFENGFSFFNEQDLQNLSTGQAICRVERPENDFNLLVRQLTIQGNLRMRDEVIKHSNATYGTPRTEVEKLLDPLLNEPRYTEDIVQNEPIEEVILPKQEPVTTEKVVIVREQAPVLESTDKKDESVSVPLISEEEKAKTKERLVHQKEVSRHRYLQTLIKKMAESRGYKAQIEQPTPDGQGRVDVLLDRNGKRIACEIGVTTSKTWEAHNIEKCLAAGYDIAVAIANDERAKALMQVKVDETIDKANLSRVYVMEASELFHYLDTEIAKDSKVNTKFKGYRVKVEYENVSKEDMKKKQDSIAKLVIDSTKNKEIR